MSQPELVIEPRESLGEMLAGIRVSASMMDAIEARAAALGCGVSAYIRALVQRDLDAQSATHPQRASAKSATR